MSPWIFGVRFLIATFDPFRFPKCEDPPFQILPGRFAPFLFQPVQLFNSGIKRPELKNPPDFALSEPFRVIRRDNPPVRQPDRRGNPC